MILLIDNYDSFTYNLAHLIAETGREIVVKRNDAITADAALALAPEAIVLSPGPSTPDKAGICLALVEKAAATGAPVFGVCLGLQLIAQALGGAITRAKTLMHGKTSSILVEKDHHNRGIFNGLPARFTATRYHSLIADPARLPECLAVTARSDGDNEIMAVAHRNKPIAAVQFHPESIASEYGAQLIGNFLNDPHGGASSSVGAATGADPKSVS